METHSEMRLGLRTETVLAMDSPMDFQGFQTNRCPNQSN